MCPDLSPKGVNGKKEVVRFGFLVVVRMAILFFWGLMPCRLVGIYQRFGETYHLHLQG
jgi:hypothetical protein